MNRVTIQSMTKSKKRNVCTVELDTGEQFNLVIDIVAKYKLAKGQTLDAKHFNEILQEQKLIDAKNIALNFVSYKQRTRKEVIQKLHQKHFSENDIQNAIKFLEDFGYIDDRSFAKNFAKLCIEQKKYSIPRIKQLLFQKGIDKDIIEEVLKDLSQGTEEFDNALSIGLKKLKQLERQGKDKAIQRVAQYLRTKGFSWEIIEKVCNNLQKGTNAYTDD